MVDNKQKTTKFVYVQLSNMRKNIKRVTGSLFQVTFIRFLFIGFINTIVGYSAFSLMIYIGLHYSLAALFGTVIGVFFNYFSTGTYVFRNRGLGKLCRFIGVYVIVYVFNLVLLKLFILAKINLYLGGAAAIAPTAVFSYFMNKFLVFKNEKAN